jgi:mannose-1-phosphate guanylyltransferase/mannose-6-phosphate isomerase
MGGCGVSRYGQDGHHREGHYRMTKSTERGKAVAAISAPIIPVILAGGVGNRLWPLSREAYPKQFLSLMGSRSLVQETLLRYADRRQFSAPIIVTNEATRFTLAEQVQEIGQGDATLLLEPAGRGTAPAVALAAMLAVERSPDAIIVVAPSDHAISDLAAFRASLETALVAAQGDQLVTFAVTPQRAETGYGYIKCGEALPDLAGAHRIAAFIEKPDAARAEALVSDGAHFWNSGMFVFRASVYLDELERFAPEIVTAMRSALAGRYQDLGFLRLSAAAFAASPSISIDYAVMERTDRACTVTLDAGWSDIGSWSELWRVAERDTAGNVVSGDVLLRDSRDCLVIGDHGLTTLIGVGNLAVVTTDDAVLVASLDQDQAVREVVAELRRGNRPELAHHRQVRRPWGAYHLLHAGSGFQVKRLTVKPGASLSLQRHRRRAEHWVVVSGTARITRDDEVLTLQPNQSTFMPIGTLHRLENPGSEPLILIEVQSGSYFGEDDIERIEDAYGRTSAAEGR